jgi:uncharacterized membrane protein YdbT with pleckstrin-like domain
MDSEDIMETPIDHIQGDEDEIAKMILSELEKQKKEKDEIANLELSLANENLQPQVQQPQVQQPQVEQPQVQPEQSSDGLTDTLNKDVLIIAILVFILSQPSIQNLIPKTNPIIKTILISGLAAGGFYLYKKGNF